LWDKGDANKASVGFQKLTEQRLEMTEKLFLSMNKHEKGKYWAKIHPKLLLFYNFAVENQEKHPHLLTEMFTLQLKTKGILLNSTQRVKNQILNGENENLKKKHIEWLDEKEQLSLYYTLSKEELKEDGINLDSLEQASHDSEKELIKMSSEFAKAYEFPTTDFHKIKSILKPNEVAVEVVKLPKYDKILTDKLQYALIVAHPHKNHAELVLLENRNELETKYTKFYRTVITTKFTMTILIHSFGRN
jgi:hypothetical protein